MQPSHSISWWIACGLGAIDGLAVGVVLEYSRVIYENHQIEVRLQEAAELGRWIGFKVTPAFDLFIPIICMIAFAVVSFFGFRYLRRRPQSVLLLWALCGTIAVCIEYVMAGTVNPSGLLYVALFSGISYLVYWFWKRHPDSVLLFWQVIGISTVLTFAAGTQIIGLFRVQRWELRRPWLWLFCLLVILLVNLIYGTVLQLIFSQNARNKAQTHN